MTTAAATLPGTYNADPVHSSFGFAVRYQNVSLFKGTLNEVTATLVDGKLEGTAKVESISIRTPEQFRAHVLSPDFFDVENHPTVGFRSTGVRSVKGERYAVDGELTVLGVTKPVTLDLEYQGSITDPFGNDKAVFSASTEIDREDWGLSWNQALESGGVLVGKKAKIEIEIEAVHNA